MTTLPSEMTHITNLSWTTMRRQPMFQYTRLIAPITCYTIPLKIRKYDNYLTIEENSILMRELERLTVNIFTEIGYIPSFFQIFYTWHVNIDQTGHLEEHTPYLACLDLKCDRLMRNVETGIVYLKFEIIHFQLISPFN